MAGRSMTPLPRPRRSLRLRTRFMLVAGAAVAIGLLVNTFWAYRGVASLEDSAAEAVAADLHEVSREYLETYLAETSSGVADALAAAEADLAVVAAAAHSLRGAPAAPPRWKMMRTVLGALQNEPGEWPAILVYPYLQFRGQPRPEVARELERTAALDPVLMSVARHGRSRPLQVYLMGPVGREIVRLAPWVNVADATETLYPGAHVIPWYPRFFPGLVEGWERDRTTETTYTAPYDDAAGGGLIISLFRPLWRDGAFEGAIGIDITLNDIARRISAIRLARTGFAFLVRGDGNVIVANDQAFAELRMAAPRLEAAGVKILTRNLAESGDPGVAAIAGTLPRVLDERADEILIGGEEFVLVLRLLRSIPVWSGAGIAPERWLIGFLVRKSELYAAVSDARHAVVTAGREILFGQVVLSLATLLLVLGGILVLTRRLTAPLSALAQASAELAQRRYDVSVPGGGGAEVGELARSFNTMAAEVREHTANLEALVAQRTGELNRSLEQLWSEMSLAHKIQTVLLPTGVRARGYDIAAVMRPAETVGGDYYDFFTAGDSVWVLVGDVSDHGISAGLIMMMAQTAVRTAACRPGAPLSPAALLTTVNAAIHENVEKIGLHQFMTICALRLDGGRVTFAGLHLDLLVWRAARGEVERVATKGVWLGLTDDIGRHLEDATLELDEEDVLFLYTDGLIEAPHEGGMFGAEGLLRAIDQVIARGKPAQTVVEELLQAVPAKVFEDDVSVVVVRRTS